MTGSKERPEIVVASSDAEREAIYRFRYRVYVEEMNRYRSVADHDGKRLVEPDDARSHLFYASDGEAVIGDDAAHLGRRCALHRAAHRAVRPGALSSPRFRRSS